MSALRRGTFIKLWMSVGPEAEIMILYKQKQKCVKIKKVRLNWRYISNGIFTLLTEAQSDLYARAPSSDSKVNVHSCAM